MAAAAVALISLVTPQAWLALAFGLAAPLAPLWLLWLGLASLPGLRLPRAGPQFVAGAALLSLALPPLLSLWSAGGLLGGGLRTALAMVVGPNGAVFLLLLAAASGPLLMLGRHREQIILLAYRALVRRARAPRSEARVPPQDPPGRLYKSLPAEQRSRATAALDAGHEAGRVREPELVIVGPEADTDRKSHRDRARKPAEPVVGTSGSARPSAAPSLDRSISPSPHHPTTSWELPSLQLLSSGKQAGVSHEDLKAQARVIEQTLESFRLPVRVAEVRQGPSVSQFGVEPSPGVAVDRVASRSHDLALRLGARSIRMQVPIPGRTLLGIEVPNGETGIVTLRETLEHARFKDRPALPIALGKDVAGHSVVVDLARLPHLLIAGATGSGKSMGLNALLTSLLMARSPEEVQFVLIDPKRVELVAYTGVPHLRMPVLTDMERVLGVLRWALEELESRFSRFAAATCRNLEAFNQGKKAHERLPRLVIVIDELADLMLTVPDEVERCLCRLAQLGRAAGIHLVVATQRPSVDVLTGLIKANFPARIAFAVSSLMDSRVVLDTAGAEQLLGRGDMLFQAPDAAKPRRIQGAFVEERELREVVRFWRRQGAPGFGQHEADELVQRGRQALADPEDELLTQARALAAEHERISASFLQRRLGIGYPKAARLIQRLQELENETEEGQMDWRESRE